MECLQFHALLVNALRVYRHLSLMLRESLASATFWVRFCPLGLGYFSCLKHEGWQRNVCEHSHSDAFCGLQNR